jgi:rod shape determining protein RodA
MAYHDNIDFSSFSTLRKLQQLPFFTILLILLLSSVGFVMMYTAAKGNINPWLSKQLIHFAISFPLMIIIAVVDIRFWYKISYLAYFFTIILLVLIEIIGHTAKGGTRWINLGFINLQPSELMKICLVFALARYFHNINLTQLNKTYNLLIPLALTIVPFIMIVKQPDLGTAGILLLISGLIFFAAGVSIWKFAIVLTLAITSLPFSWHFLHDYQKNRIITFLNPENDPLGTGYNIIQSKIAIGSGGFWGKGLLKGTQSQLNFLPERQTDFIFTMISEELGFMKSFLILLLYTILILYSIFTAINCRNHYGRLVAIGITALFFFHVFINTGMVMGLLPAVGVPLPLLSYGGTIMLTTLCGFGFILNVYIHSHTKIVGNN